MSGEASVSTLLTTLLQSLDSALESTPSSTILQVPKDGISLLDTKNDLLLAYLQNLVFLIVLKLRNRSSISGDKQSIADAVVQKLVEIRVYLEKGVRPLEGRLKYQIDKVLRAAENASRPVSIRSEKTKASLRKGRDSVSESDGSAEESEDEQDDEAVLRSDEIDDLQYRPNPAAFVQPQVSTVDEERAEQGGLYRPPRFNATSMPTTNGPRKKEARKPHKSATLDEFINTEMSTAPFAEPSIGSTIVAGGRRTKSERERKDEAERQEYEERNYVRLPKESKKERAKKGRPRDAGYGGEEWRGLGEGIDRIERLTKSKGGAKTVLERSRKRPAEDAPRGGGARAEVGQGFQKRVKTLDRTRKR